MTSIPVTSAAERYRRASDYLAACMIYLRDNVLLREPLRPEHLKPRLLGHWGTCPGITYVYTGLNGVVARTGRRTLLVTGPGHGAPTVHANLWLEGTHAAYDPALARDAAGMAEYLMASSCPCRNGTLLQKRVCWYGVSAFSASVTKGSARATSCIRLSAATSSISNP